MELSDARRLRVRPAAMELFGSQLHQLCYVLAQWHEASTERIVPAFAGDLVMPYVHLENQAREYYHTRVKNRTKSLTLVAQLLLDLKDGTAKPTRDEAVSREQLEQLRYDGATSTDRQRQLLGESASDALDNHRDVRFREYILRDPATNLWNLILWYLRFTVCVKALCYDEPASSTDETQHIIFGLRTRSKRPFEP